MTVHSPTSAACPCTVQDGERTVVLKSGGKLIDSLDEIMPAERSYSYRLFGRT